MSVFSHRLRPGRVLPSEGSVTSRRALLRLGAWTALGIPASGLLSACGDGDIVSALQPARFIVLGDGLSDLGEGGSRYTINDGSRNTWVDQFANRFGKTVTTQALGGLGYARGHGAAEPLPRSVAAQVDAFLAGNTIGTADVVLLNLPMAEVLTRAAAVKSGTLTEAAALTQIDTAGRGLVDQVRRLIAAGARYVVVCGVYDLSKSPWATAQQQTGFFAAASLRLNDAFKVEAVKLGGNVLFIDAAFLVNRNIEFGPNFGFLDSKNPICTTPTAATCNDSTLSVTAANKSQYLFADAIHLTPEGQRQLGDYAYDQFKTRW